MPRAFSFLSTLTLALACAAGGGCSSSSSKSGCTTDKDCTESTTFAFCDTSAGECIKGVHCEYAAQCTRQNQTCENALGLCVDLTFCKSTGDCPSDTRCDTSPGNGTEPPSGICVQVACLETGAACAKGSDCCSHTCTAGTCG